MSLPNFLHVGAAKTGTTSTYFYLRQHPAVFRSGGTTRSGNLSGWFAEESR